MGYIEELRVHIGHRPIIMVGAGVLITDAQGRLLLGERTDNHTWSIPGGAMEPGEDLEETARREALEEAGLTLGALQLFGVFSGSELFYTYPNGDQVYNVSVMYTCSDYQETRAVLDEHTVFRFFPPETLPRPISPPVRPIIEAWLRRAR
jgi:8-oxo-dGTP pyrophosphatase MutT (NUDIX family)